MVYRLEGLCELVQDRDYVVQVGPGRGGFVA